MQKVLLLTLCVFLLFVGNAFSQVVADFETDDGGFVVGWGGSLVSLSQVADPSGVSSGVLQLSVNADLGDGKAAIKKPGPLEYRDAQVIAYYLWLPADTPDNLLLKAWIQGAGWQWNDDKTLAMDVPKETWYPVYFHSNRRDLPEGPFEEMGMEVYAGDLTGEDTLWTGDIYIDNVSLIGVEPKLIADFETDLGNFVIGWGNGVQALTQVADPSGVSAGVMEIDYNADLGDTKAAIKWPGPVDHMDANLIVYHVWLPASTPDNLLIKAWAQGAGWQWNDDKYLGSEIPKETWYPIYFNPEIRDMPEGDYEEMGLEIYGGDLTGDDTTFAAMIYVDNVWFLTTETGVKWLLSDFESPVAGVQGFTLAGWGTAGTSIERAEDPSGQSDGVLQLNHDYNAGVKSYVSKDGILLWSDETQTNVTAISMDVWIPPDFPGSSKFEIVMNGEAMIPAWTWTPTLYDSSTLVWGDWNTLMVDVQTLIDSGKVDYSKTAVVGVQTFDDDPQTWSGALYMDNLTLYGISQPAGELASPELVIAHDTTAVVGGSGIVDFVRFDWLDNTLGTEKYNIYMSTESFSSIDDEGVILYAANIPHGLEKYAHRPYTSDGSEQTYYYAITATDGVTETGYVESAYGSITTPTTPTWKIKYVEDFASSFVLDGLNTEFESYVEEYQITPETAFGSAYDEFGWEPGSSDLDFKVTMVIDDEYLYVSGDVTDDDLRDVEGGFQAWQGDALELYMGFYDVKKLDEWHQKGDNRGGVGDWRISFTSMGDVQLGGYESYDVPGLESVVFAKFTGDGYIAEAKFNLDSLAVDDFVVMDGMWMPFKIDNTDQDPNLNNDEERTLALGVGSVPTGDAEINMDEDWLRPHAWGLLEVEGGPTAIDDKVNNPIVFKLHDNYPNPFNPKTTIRYDIPEKSLVKLKVYDILGREVATLVNKQVAAGNYSIDFDASKLATGVYIYRITTDNFTSTKKMMLLK